MESSVVFPESHQDLLKAEIAVLATIGPKGYPQVTAVWFLWDEDGLLKMSMKTTRQKVKNLIKRSECTLFIMDPENAGRTIEIRGNAELIPDPDYAFADRLGAKYGAHIRDFDQPGESRVQVILRPTKVNLNG
jgi:PPOX class probable F420-dependent enzyme